MIPDPALTKILEIFQNSELLEPRHNCDIEGLFQLNPTRFWDALYEIKSEEAVIGSILFYQQGHDFVSKEAVNNNSESYPIMYPVRASVEFQEPLLESLYTDEEFKQVVEQMKTDYIKINEDHKSLTIKITGKYDITDIKETIRRIVELAEFFDSRITDEKGATSFQKFASTEMSNSDT